MSRFLSRLAFVACLIAIPAWLAWSFSVAGSQSDGRVYDASENAMADVDAALAQAKADKKLLLIALGANWCHDSRAFGSRFSNPDFAATMQKSYEILFVDVGYLDTGFDVIKRFGPPVIYGTPTVLVIDPETEVLLNPKDHTIWRDSYKISLADTLKAFEKIAADRTAQLSSSAISPALQGLYGQIDAFEQKMANRVYAGFAIVGPMLAESRAGGEMPKNLGSYWKQLAKFRYAVTDDLRGLRDDAAKRVAAGEANISIAWPNYEPFDWE